MNQATVDSILVAVNEMHNTTTWSFKVLFAAISIYFLIGILVALLRMGKP